MCRSRTNDVLVVENTLNSKDNIGDLCFWQVKRLESKQAPEGDFIPNLLMSVTRQCANNPLKCVGKANTKSLHC